MSWAKVGTRKGMVSVFKILKLNVPQRRHQIM